jgi:hypothetical protein
MDVSIKEVEPFQFIIASKVLSPLKLVLLNSIFYYSVLKEEVIMGKKVIEIACETDRTHCNSARRMSTSDRRDYRKLKLSTENCHEV